MLGTVNAKTGDASRRAVAIHRQQILPIAWLLVLAAASLAALMLFAAITLDASMRKESINAMRAGLNERADQLAREAVSTRKSGARESKPASASEPTELP